MLHVFPRFSRTAADTPFGDALRETGVPHRIIASDTRQTYRYRLQLLLLGYPALAASAFAAARRSLFAERPRPDAVLLSSDVEVLVFALMRRLRGAARPLIVLMPFIFTARASAAVNRLRTAYYGLVLGQVGLAICHSSLEVARYRVIFARSGARFTFVRWGTHVPDAATIRARSAAPAADDALPAVVSAGRSGRDYPALVEATAPLACRTVIVCNEEVALGGVVETPCVVLLRRCFGLDYLRVLLEARVVAVPLRVDDISAGQMVLIQAMALGRPLVVTRTPTIEDYLEDGRTALLVPRGDVGALRAAVARLLDEPALASQLGAAAREAYEQRFGPVAHMRAVVEAIASMTPPDARAAAAS